MDYFLLDDIDRDKDGDAEKWKVAMLHTWLLLGSVKKSLLVDALGMIGEDDSAAEIVWNWPSYFAISISVRECLETFMLIISDMFSHSYDLIIDEHLTSLAWDLTLSVCQGEIAAFIFYIY